MLALLHPNTDCSSHSNHVQATPKGSSKTLTYPDKQKYPCWHSPLQESCSIPGIPPNVPAGHLRVGVAVPSGQ